MKGKNIYFELFSDAVSNYYQKINPLKNLKLVKQNKKEIKLDKQERKNFNINKQITDLLINLIII